MNILGSIEFIFLKKKKLKQTFTQWQKNGVGIEWSTRKNINSYFKICGAQQLSFFVLSKIFNDTFCSCTFYIPLKYRIWEIFSLNLIIIVIDMSIDIEIRLSFWMILTILSESVIMCYIFFGIIKLITFKFQLFM